MDHLVGESGLNGSLRERESGLNGSLRERGRTKWIVKEERQD